MTMSSNLKKMGRAGMSQLPMAFPEEYIKLDKLGKQAKK